MARTVLRVALVEGEAYAPLYDRLPQFTEETGLAVEVAYRAPLSELIEHFQAALPAGEPYHLISLHSQYTAAFAPYLRLLDDRLPPVELSAFEPAALDLCRLEGQVYQLPRAQEARLLFYRSDFFDDRRERQWFREASGGRELRVPETWEDLAAVAQYFTRADTCHGFAFPGKGTGLVATFAEIVTSVGGTCFGPDGRPLFYSRAGEWALQLLRDLLLRWEAVPAETPELGYTEVSERFRLGKCALACDFPGTAHLLCDPCFSAVAGWHGVAPYPTGSSGKRAVWSGCSAFAIPARCPDPEAAVELLRYLTSTERQLAEGKQGALPARTDALRELREGLREGTLAQRRFALAEETLRTAALTAPAVPEYPELERQLALQLRAALTGEREVVAALEEAQRACEAILEARG